MEPSPSIVHVVIHVDQVTRGGEVPPAPCPVPCHDTGLEYQGTSRGLQVWKTGSHTDV